MRPSPLVHIVLAPNPGVMTGPGTNTYILGTGPRFVVDPAVDDPEYLHAVTDAAGEVAAVLITHRHPDHVGGVRALVQRSGAPVRAFGDAPAGGMPVVPLRDGERLRAGSVTVTAWHTPGHASDHVCFLLEDTASLLSGDCILGEGTAVIAPPDGDMRAYMQSLDKLKDLEIARIYPGHFRPLDGGRTIIEGYIAHRLDRERKILAALRSEPQAVEDIVVSAYADTPVHLHPVARYSALAHLEKLASEGRARAVGDRWAAGVD